MNWLYDENTAVHSVLNKDIKEHHAVLTLHTVRSQPVLSEEN